MLRGQKHVLSQSTTPFACTLVLTVSGSTPTPWSGPFRDHGLRPWSRKPPLSTENPRIKGFSGSGAPIFGFGLADPRPRGRGRPLFAEVLFSEICLAMLTSKGR